MKNSITITIDADNLEPIRFSKKEYENKFPNTEEAKENNMKNKENNMKNKENIYLT